MISGSWSGHERKDELTPARIDRGWPHQVALAADQMAGANYQAVHEFCKDLSLCPSGHGVRRVALLI